MDRDGPRSDPLWAEQDAEQPPEQPDPAPGPDTDSPPRYCDCGQQIYLHPHTRTQCEGCRIKRERNDHDRRPA